MRKTHKTHSIEIHLFFVAMAALTVFVFLLFPITDNDIWWHMAGGKVILENLRIPQAEIFSYSAAGEPWHINSWIFDALSYIVYKLAGLNGLNILKAAIGALTFVLIALYLRQKKALNYFSLLFIVAAIFSVRDGFSLRPHTFSYLIFVIFLILRFKYRERKTYKLIISLALLQLFWVNFHSYFLWGIALSGIILVSETVKNRRIEKKDIVLAVSIFIASLLYAAYGYNHLLGTLRGYFLSFDSGNAQIREHLPPSFETFLSLLGLILLSWFIVLYFGYREKRFDLLFMAGMFGFAGMTAVRSLRDLVLFLCLAAPPYFSKISFPRLPRIPQTAQAALFSLSLLIFLAWAKNSSPGIGLGLSKFTYPVEAAEFIKNEQLLEKSGGNLYNTYNFGGYLLWKIYPKQVFIDSRMQPYVEKVFQIYWKNFEGGDVWRGSIEKYNITIAIMILPHTDGKTVFNDSLKMFPAEKWALIYYDDVATIYTKRIPALDDVVQKYEYKIINPQMMNLNYLPEKIQSQEDWERAMNEIKMGLEINPESYRLHFTLAYLYGMVGAEEKLKEALQRTLKINPQFQAAKEILDQVSK